MANTRATHGFRTTAVAALALALGLPTQSQAVEGGSGFYLLGSRTTMGGAVPPPGVYTQSSVYQYSGSSDVDIPQGGALDLGLEGDAALMLLSMIWAPSSATVLGGRPYLSFTLPAGWKQSSINARVTGPGGGTISGSRENSSTLFGDPVVGGGVGWGSGPVFTSLNLLVNVPIGDYDADNSTNIAFHRWGADLTGAVSWVGAGGMQASAALGVTFNGENDDTDYTSGDELHLEAAIGKTFANGVMLGLQGYHYLQITGDDGDGAVLADFKGRVSALGPAISWSGSWGGPRFPSRHGISTNSRQRTG